MHRYGGVAALLPGNPGLWGSDNFSAVELVNTASSRWRFEDRFENIGATGVVRGSSNTMFRSNVSSTFDLLVCDISCTYPVWVRHQATDGDTDGNWGPMPDEPARLPFPAGRPVLPAADKPLSTRPQTGLGSAYLNCCA